MGAAIAGEDVPQDDGRARNRTGLDKQLLNEAAATGANREPQSHFARSGRTAREHEIGEIGTCEQQDQSHNGRENPQRPLEAHAKVRHAVRGWAQRHSGGNVAIHVLRLGMPGLQRSAACSRLKAVSTDCMTSRACSADVSRFEPAYHFEPVPARIAERLALRICRQGNPESPCECQVRRR